MSGDNFHEMLGSSDAPVGHIPDYGPARPGDPQSHLKGDRDAEDQAIAFAVLGVRAASTTKLREHHFLTPLNRVVWGKALKMTEVPMPSDLGVPLEQWDRYMSLRVRAQDWDRIEQRIINAASANKLANEAADLIGKLARGGAEALATVVPAFRLLVEDCAAGMPDDAVLLSKAIEETTREWTAHWKDGTPVVIPVPSKLAGAIGGFQRGKVILIVARSSEHKTTAALSLLRHAAQHGYEALFWIMEDDRGDLAARSMAHSCTGLTTRMIQQGQKPAVGPDNANRIFRELKGLQQSEASAKMRIIDRGNPTLSDVLTRVRAAHAQKRLDIVALDYGQLIRSDRGTIGHEHWEQVTAALQALAKELSITLIVTCQVDKMAGRETKANNMPPTTLDVRGGATWHNNCYGSLCLSAKGDGRLVVRIDKWKNGEKRTMSFGVDAARDSIDWD